MRWLTFTANAGNNMAFKENRPGDLPRWVGEQCLSSELAVIVEHLSPFSLA